MVPILFYSVRSRVERRMVLATLLCITELANTMRRSTRERTL